MTEECLRSLLEIFGFISYQRILSLDLFIQYIAEYGRCHMFEGWKNKARLLKTEVYAIYLAYKDPKVPWYARILAVCVVGYALSPMEMT